MKIRKIENDLSLNELSQILTSKHYIIKLFQEQKKLSLNQNIFNFNQHFVRKALFKNIGIFKNIRVKFPLYIITPHESKHFTAVLHSFENTKSLIFINCYSIHFKMYKNYSVNNFFNENRMYFFLDTILKTRFNIFNLLKKNF